MGQGALLFVCRRVLPYMSIILIVNLYDSSVCNNNTDYSKIRCVCCLKLELLLVLSGVS